MITDRELLSLAALAVNGGAWHHLTHDTPNGRFWNPLEDDGDALRLLASLPSLWSLNLKFGAPDIVMDIAWGFKGIKVTEFNGQNTDRAKCIRRAIVNAAAKIGENIIENRA